MQKHSMININSIFFIFVHHANLLSDTKPGQQLFLIIQSFENKATSPTELVSIFSQAL